jgi:hypothetical protein
MTIQVTQQHIKKGLRGSCSGDPVSLAMKSAGLNRPWASLDHLAWRVDFRDYFVRTPENVVKFIIDFDNNRPVAPFSFELDV